MDIKKRNKLRRLLVKEVEECLVKKFKEQGFKCDSFSPGSFELSVSFPLGQLKRERNGKLDIVEFQFDKYRRPIFVINVGIAPEEGITTSWGKHISRDEIDALSCPGAYRIYSSRFIRRRFKLGLFSPKSEMGIKKLVSKAMLISQEILQWLDEKKVGKHMGRIGL